MNCLHDSTGWQLPSSSLYGRIVSQRHNTFHGGPRATNSRDSPRKGVSRHMIIWRHVVFRPAGLWDWTFYSTSWLRKDEDDTYVFFGRELLQNKDACYEVNLRLLTAWLLWYVTYDLNFWARRKSRSWVRMYFVSWQHLKPTGKFSISSPVIGFMRLTYTTKTTRYYKSTSKRLFLESMFCSCPGFWACSRYVAWRVSQKSYFGVAFQRHECHLFQKWWIWASKFGQNRLKIEISILPFAKANPT